MTKEQRIEEMKKVIIDAFLEDYNIGCDPCADTVAEHLYDAEFRKERHSYWVRDNTYTGKHQERYFCVNCNHWQYNKKSTPNQRAMYMNYCPQCGAKMKGGAE